MKTYDISRLPSSITPGWDGENNWRPIAFDCSALLAGHSDGVVTLWLLPKGETQAFPVALSMDGNVVTWTPLSEEMTAERGQLQIVVQDGTDVGKSKVVDYTVHDSLVGGADHPAETPSWAVQVVADVTEQADRAEAAAESIDPESIEQTVADAVEDYIEQHPVTVEETDPTVPAWAKNPTKPTYTAAEVGALPDSYTPPVTSVNGKTGAVTITATELGALTEHQSLAAYRTASAQDAIDAAQDTAIAGKYTKPSGGIPASDLASGVVPEINTDPNDAVWQIDGKVIAAQYDGDANEIHTTYATKSEISGMATQTWVGQKGYQTAQQVQTAIAAIPAELPTVSASDNGKVLRVVSGAWAAQAVPAAESNSFGGGS